MSVQLTHYPKTLELKTAYREIRDFLIEIKDTEYCYARWDWMITHSMTEIDNLAKIAMWKDKDELVGLAIFDIEPDIVFIRTKKAYDYLKKEIVSYVEQTYGQKHMVKIMIQDDDELLKRVVAEKGFLPINHKEYTSVFYTEQTDYSYDLPDGFKVVSLKEAPSVYQYYRLFWRGFNHELNGEGKYTHSDKKEAEGKREIYRENNDLDHKIIIQNSQGEHVAFCGLWYDKKIDFALVEPLATDPDYRRRGLAMAAMYEGIKRVHQAGAKRVMVGTNKQFYYNRGFRPFRTQTVWEKKIV
jgi:N-acetylglutamate synthase-like GNAT family acetyltransferase